MPIRGPKITCRHCYHPEAVHNIQGTGECGCGCVTLVPIDFAAREARQRAWLVDVAFFVKNRWIAAEQQRVKAGGPGGAAVKGIRRAKAAVRRSRQRVAQVKLTITPISRP